MSYDYRNIREVLKQSLECESGEVFVRALMGYVTDEYFWENASEDDCEMVANLCEIVVSEMQRLKEAQS